MSLEMDLNKKRTLDEQKTHDGGEQTIVQNDDGGDGNEPTAKKPKKIVVVKKIVRKIRKARQQVPKRSADEELQKEEVAGDYNIWYHKYNGQRFSFKDRT